MNAFDTIRSSGPKDSKCRVLLVHPRYGWYRRTYFAALADAFDLKLVAAMDDHPDDPMPAELRARLVAESLSSPGVRVGHYTLRSLVRLWRVVWRSSADVDLIVASTQAPVHSKIAFLIAVVRRLPFAVVVQQWVERPREGLARDLYNRFSVFIMRHARACLAHGKLSAEYCVRAGVSAERVYVYPYTSADLSVLVSKVPGEQAAEGPCRILYAGRLVEVKGVEILLEAYARAVASGATLNLDLAGDGPLREALEAQYAHLERIRFLGRLSPPDVVDAMHACDALVLPSIMTDTMNEGWGLVVSEAASLGKALIVTTAVGSAPELVHEGENGYVVQHSNVEALAEALIDFARKPAEERRRMGQRSREFFEIYNDPQVCVEVLQRILREAASPTGRCGAP